MIVEYGRFFDPEYSVYWQEKKRQPQEQLRQQQEQVRQQQEQVRHERLQQQQEQVRQEQLRQEQLRHERLQQEQLRQNLNLLEKKRKAVQQHLLALEAEQACTRQLAEQLHLARAEEQSKVASLRAFHSQRVAEVNRLRINTRKLGRKKTTSYSLSADRTQSSAPPLDEFLPSAPPSDEGLLSTPRSGEGLPSAPPLDSGSCLAAPLDERDVDCHGRSSNEARQYFPSLEDDEQPGLTTCMRL